MAKFRKKPVVIEAWHVPFAPPKDAPMWVVEAILSGKLRALGHQPPHSLEVNTLEGIMEASPGDWIIQGVKGELYPCKPDIFALTYEAVDETTPGR